MPLYLHTIKPGAGATKSRKRIGRGNSSGHGTYSTRGLKGQKARSGVSNLKRLGLKKMLLNIPKSRGFKSPYPKDQVVNLVDLNKHFKDNETINVKTLARKKLIDSTEMGVKILGKGQLKVNGLTFEGVSMSQSVKEQVEKLGGKIK